jgi:hypothetical protein
MQLIALGSAAKNLTLCALKEGILSNLSLKIVIKKFISFFFVGSLFWTKILCITKEKKKRRQRGELESLCRSGGHRAQCSVHLNRDYFTDNQAKIGPRAEQLELKKSTEK